MFNPDLIQYIQRSAASEPESSWESELDGATSSYELQGTPEQMILKITFQLDESEWPVSQEITEDPTADVCLLCIKTDELGTIWDKKFLIQENVSRGDLLQKNTYSIEVPSEANQVGMNVFFSVHNVGSYFLFTLPTPPDSPQQR